MVINNWNLILQSFQRVNFSSWIIQLAVLLRTSKEATSIIGFDKTTKWKFIRMPNKYVILNNFQSALFINLYKQVSYTSFRSEWFTILEELFLLIIKKQIGELLNVLKETNLGGWKICLFPVLFLATKDPSMKTSSPTLYDQRITIWHQTFV